MLWGSSIGSGESSKKGRTAASRAINSRSWRDGPPAGAALGGAGPAAGMNPASSSAKARLPPRITTLRHSGEGG